MAAPQNVHPDYLRTCKECGELKVIYAFQPTAPSSAYRRHVCRECRNSESTVRRRRQRARGPSRRPDLLPTDHPSILDIAWAAGIYEGEGCCVYSTGSHHLTVSQKDPWILHRLKRLFGGSIAKRSDPHEVHNWRIYGPRARGFLMTIYSFLSPRRIEQAVYQLMRVKHASSAG